MRMDGAECRQIKMRITFGKMKWISILKIIYFIKVRMYILKPWNVVILMVFHWKIHLDTEKSWLENKPQF